MRKNEETRTNARENRISSIIKVKYKYIAELISRKYIPVKV
jgi:hypothetical protein